MIRRHDLAGRGWRARADLERRLRRRGSATPAIRSFNSIARGSSEWLASTAQGFDHYRSIHDPAADRATVICVSQRPDLIDDVVANVIRQDADIEVEFVFVTNHEAFATVDLGCQFSETTGVSVIEMPATASLGACLNAGLAATGERFVAKFDDDDWYGPHYLADALRAHGYAGAGVVGKHTYYADVGDPAERYLRFPGHEFSYSGTLAGGTLVIDRDRVGDLAFDDVSIGEDRRFLAACHRRGVSTFSADRFGFVQRRDGRNTWSVSDEQFLVGCTAVDPADPVHDVGR